MRKVSYFIKLRSCPSWTELSDNVLRWQDCGINGVVVSDHIFTERVRPSSTGGDRHDAAILFAALAATHTRLEYLLLVANVGLSHPYFVIRQFAELAHLFGGRNFTLGLGAGWHADEFDSLGIEMPRHGERIERLLATCKFAMELLHEGYARESSSDVLAYNNLPMIPFPVEPPRLAVGGGSLGVIEVGARYADHFDFDAAHPGLTPGDQRSDARANDMLRRLATTESDIVVLQEALSRRLRTYGRDKSAQRWSINVNSVVLGERDNIDERLFHDLRVRLRTGIYANTAALDASCPFVVFGNANSAAERLASRIDRLRLDAVVLPDVPDSAKLMRALSDLN